jgi:hypothetical protein
VGVVVQGGRWAETGEDEDVEDDGENGQSECPSTLQAGTPQGKTRDRARGKLGEGKARPTAFDQTGQARHASDNSRRDQKLVPSQQDSSGGKGNQKRSSG